MSRLLSVTIAAALCVPAVARTQSAPPPLPPRRCETSPLAKQFDFWVGDWDVTPWAGGTFPGGAHGHSRVERLVAGCAIMENWTSPRATTGKSLNFYDPNIGKWRQMWIDEFEGALTYTGEYRDGAMRFDGWTLGAKGDTVLQKLNFYNVAPDTVRQQFQQSTDRGATWQTTFDARYVRVKP